jgi:hypothetical protein
LFDFGFDTGGPNKRRHPSKKGPAQEQIQQENRKELGFSSEERHYGREEIKSNYCHYQMATFHQAKRKNRG